MSFKLHDLWKDTLCKYDHILRDCGLEVQHRFWGNKIQPVHKVFIIQVINVWIFKNFPSIFLPNESAYNNRLMEQNKMNLKKRLL